MDTFFVFVIWFFFLRQCKILARTSTGYVVSYIGTNLTDFKYLRQILHKCRINPFLFLIQLNLTGMYIGT